MSSTYTDKNNPFSRWTKRHSQFAIFSQPCFNRMFSICLSHDGPPKGGPYRFRSKETTGSSTVDHDLGHLCRGRRIQTSGHSDRGIFNNLGSILHSYQGFSRYCVSCLARATRQSGDDNHDFFLLSFVMLMILVRWILHKIQSRLLKISPRSTTRPLFFGTLPPIRNSSNDICPSMMQNELLRSISLLHRSPLSCFWLSSGSTPKFSLIFPFPVRCCLRCWNFHSLMQRNKFVNQIVVLQWISPFPATWSSSWCGIEFPIRILVDSSVSRIHASFVWILLDPQLPQFFIILQGIAGATDVSNFLPAFLMVSLNSVSSGSMK